MTEHTLQDPARSPQPALLDAGILLGAAREALVKLAPRHIVRSPVMAVVLAGTVLAALITASGNAPAGFGWAVTAILLLTVLFGNFAEAVAEARGRGQAASLRRARKDLVARKLVNPKGHGHTLRGDETRLPAADSATQPVAERLTVHRRKAAWRFPGCQLQLPGRPASPSLTKTTCATG